MRIGRIALVATLALTTAGLSLGTARAQGPWIAVGGTCVAGIPKPVCRTETTMDPTFRYAIISPAPVQWYVVVCGRIDCDGANWFDGDPRTGHLVVHGCPCQGSVDVLYPDYIVKNPVYSSTPLGILTNLGP